MSSLNSFASKNIIIFYRQWIFIYSNLIYTGGLRNATIDWVDRTDIITTCYSAYSNISFKFCSCCSVHSQVNCFLITKMGFENFSTIKWMETEIMCNLKQQSAVTFKFRYIFYIRNFYLFPRHGSRGCSKYDSTKFSVFRIIFHRPTAGK